jgi:hypothetical protein
MLLNSCTSPTLSVCAVTSCGAKLGVAASDRRACAMPRVGRLGSSLARLCSLHTAAAWLASLPRSRAATAAAHLITPCYPTACCCTSCGCRRVCATPLPRRRVRSITPSPLRLCTVAARWPRCLLLRAISRLRPWSPRVASCLRCATASP